MDIQQVGWLCTLIVDRRTFSERPKRGLCLVTFGAVRTKEPIHSARKQGKAAVRGGCCEPVVVSVRVRGSEHAEQHEADEVMKRGRGEGSSDPEQASSDIANARVIIVEGAATLLGRKLAVC